MPSLRSLLTALVTLATVATVGCGRLSEEGADTPADTQPAQPGTEQPAPAQPQLPAQPGTEQPAPEQPGTEQPGTEQPGTEQPAPTQPGTEQPAPEQPATTVDRFGVTMLYPSKPQGEAWFLADDATSDPRFDSQDPITRNADGSWKMQTDQVRMNVTTSTGYQPGAITTYNRDELAAKGYMQSPNDWKNVEITGFVKVNEASDPSDNFAWYARGGRHNDANGGCEGSAYKGDLHFDGRARWAKETWHVSYEYTPYFEATSSIQGRWVGFKAVIRDTTVDGKPAVRMESYLNDNADKVTWTKVAEHVDAGDWGGDASACGGTVDAMPITWGGPTATFRWDSAPDVDFKWLSVREIQPE